MSVYNEQPSLLDECIYSILDQTHKNFEFLIIDDGSTEFNTIQKLDSICAQDNRIKLLRRKNHGLAKSLNYGIQRCNSEIIFRQDSDDWSDKKRIQTQLNFLQENPNCILVGLTPVFCQKNGDPLWMKQLPLTYETIVKAFRIINPFCHGSVCFKK